MSTVYIYTLTDPRNSIVCYAGQSKNPSSRMRRYRMGGHAKLVDWILDLKSVGLLPVMDLVKQLFDMDIGSGI